MRWTLAVSLGAWLVLWCGHLWAWPAVSVDEEGNLKPLETVFAVMGQGQGKRVITVANPRPEEKGATGIILAVKQPPTKTSIITDRAVNFADAATAPTLWSFDQYTGCEGEDEPIEYELEQAWGPRRCVDCVDATASESAQNRVGVLKRTAVAAWFEKRDRPLEGSSKALSALGETEGFLIAAVLKPDEALRFETATTDPLEIPATPWSRELTVVVATKDTRVRVTGRPEVALSAQREVDNEADIEAVYRSDLGAIWAVRPQAAVLEYAFAENHAGRRQAAAGMPREATVTRLRVRQSPADGALQLEAAAHVRGRPAWPKGKAEAPKVAATAGPSGFAVGYIARAWQDKPCKKLEPAKWSKRSEQRLERVVADRIKATEAQALPPGAVELTQPAKKATDDQTDETPTPQSNPESGEKEEAAAPAQEQDEAGGCTTSRGPRPGTPLFWMAFLLAGAFMMCRRG